MPAPSFARNATTIGTGMVRITERLRKAVRTLPSPRRALSIVAVVGLSCLALSAALIVSGCTPATTGGAATEATSAVGANMAGPAVDVNVTQAALDSKPKAWDLSSPESAVRSYLDWTSYAYRTAQSPAAVPTMSSYEEVRVDSYIQYNIQKYRVIDQKLLSITFGKPTVEGTHTLVPAKESWTYSYVSIQTAGKVLEGPFPARYDTTYTVVKNAKGDWVVDSLEAKALGTVK